MAFGNITRQQRRINRVRSVVSGTPERPRLSVTRTNKHIIAQAIDDTTGTTLLYVSDDGYKGTKIEKSEHVGAVVAEKAKSLGIAKMCFDRRGRRYHGRVKAVAEAVRNNGVEI